MAAAAAAAACLLLGASAWAGTSAAEPPLAGGQPAVWTPKEIRFVYAGFTAMYSCNGLGEKVRSILLALGARGDLQVREGPCASLGQPSVLPAVTIKMNVLQVVTDPKAAGAPSAVQAHWKSVDLPPTGNPLWTSADCELFEQVRQSILPAFATRNVEERSSCVPHQAQIRSPHLRAEVLIAEQSAGTTPGAG